MLDLEEKGYHVRAGYTLGSYRSLLEPLGFQINQVEGMGSSGLIRAHALVAKLQLKYGNLFALPFAIFALPMVQWDPRKMDRPLSLYVRALKSDENLNRRL